MARLDAIKYPPFNGHPLALLEVVRGNSDAHHRGVLRLQGREDFAAGDPGVPRVSRSKAPRYFVKPLGRFLECECCGLSLDMRLPRARLDEPPRRATPADAVREALLYLQRGADLAREVEQLHQARDDVAAVAARLEAQHSESAARVRSLGVEPR